MSETNTSRLEAFSDGVFAIAITLLILEVRIPELPESAGNREFGQALLALWPSFLAIIGSFGTILTMWTHHHRLFTLVGRVDRRLLYANGLLLLMITFVPFPTAVLARYLGRSGSSAATAFYSGTFLLIAIAFQVLLSAISRPGTHASEETRQKLLATMRRNYRWGPVSYAAAMAVSFIQPMLAFLLCGFMWVFWSLVAYERTAASGHVT